ncbi:hypothetical protein [Halioxenophilus sp. WMMB6]|uniref:hypothetical protein n=1 Tax=Halioxenophilus sp. WMMB6 TaxID=3073815 RepID=UPI00295E5AE6|nr:hypothetical protein [Halioxenophilus sp. WMMB6]
MIIKRFINILKARHNQKIVIHSLFKTGTTSVGHGLIKLGIGHREMGWNPGVIHGLEGLIKPANELANKSDTYAHFYKEYGKQIKQTFKLLKQRCENYDTFSDHPIGHTTIHPYIKRALFGKPILIWINRDQTEWLKSAKDWELTHPQIYPDAEQKWLHDEKAQINRLITMRTAEKAIFDLYKQEFPTESLELDLKDESLWQNIANHFGKNITNFTPPHLNKAKDPN